MEAPRVKICGLVRTEDARAAGEAGADYAGAVLVPGGPRAVSPERAAELGRASGRPLVAVMADLEPAEAEARAQVAGASILQLHGDEAPSQVADLRRRGPWRVWKSLRVRRASEALERARSYAGVVDGILLDSWHPARAGGTGRRFEWEAVDELRALLVARGADLVVAGGLSAENVEEAVRRLRPGVVDVSSGVEGGPGRKDPERIRAFVVAARGGGGVGMETRADGEGETGNEPSGRPGGVR